MREFGQYCGIARALELVGERWALLIVRDLSIRPHRYSDLHTGLPGIPTNVLATRLKELEQAGIVERQVAPAPQRGIVYALTPAGKALEPALLALGRWGATQLGAPRPGDVVTPDGLALNLRAAFRPATAPSGSATWEIHAGDMIVHATLADGELTTGVGPALDGAGLTIAFTPGVLPSYREMMTAITCGKAELTGDRKLLDVFLQSFATPVPVR